MNKTSPVHASGHRRWLAGSCLVVLGFAAYANSFSGKFLLDDQSSIVTNASLTRVWPPWAPFLSAGAGGTRGRPFANFTFALNRWAGGLAPAGYHAVNLAIHLLAGLTLFGILIRTFQTRPLASRLGSCRVPLAFGIAALWLLHPLVTESVTYIAQRTECLMGLCYLASLYCFIRAADSPERYRWNVAAVGACFLGTATKEVMVTAPFLIFLYDRTFLAGSFGAAWRLHWRTYLGMASSWVLLAFLMAKLGERGAGLHAGISPLTYAFSESHAIVRYLRLSFWPHPLIFDYGPALDHSPAALSLTIVFGLVVCVLFLLRFLPTAGFALAWFFVILAPTSSIVPVALQPIAENRMYLPLISLISLVSVGTYLLIGRFSAILLVVVMLIFGSMTFLRNETYQSPLLIWSDTVAKRPANARAHCNLGTTLLANHEAEQGITELREAVRIDPDDVDSNLDLGVAEANLGNITEASRRIQKALGANPFMPEAHYDAGWLDEKAGNLVEALSEYATAITLRPTYVDANFNAAGILAGEGRFADAIPHYEAALAGGPPDPDIYFNLAFARIKIGQLTEAIADYQKALELRPEFNEARRNLEILEGFKSKPKPTSP